MVDSPHCNTGRHGAAAGSVALVFMDMDKPKRIVDLRRRRDRHRHRLFLRKRGAAGRNRAPRGRGLGLGQIRRLSGARLVPRRALDRLARRSFALHASLADELGNPWGYRRLDTYGGVAAEAGPARSRRGRPWLSERVTITGRLGSPETTALVEPRASRPA